MTSLELAKKAAAFLDNKKAERVHVIEIENISSLADYFVIATGRNVQAVRSLAEDVEEKLDAEGTPVRRHEGMNESRWVVLDYAHVIVHIFHPEEREYYNIERLWMDGSNQIPFVPGGQGEAPENA